MKINIICVGKIKEKYILDGIQEFSKRLQTYTSLNIIELKEDGNDSNRELSMKREGDLILQSLDKNKGYNILLDIRGTQISSEELAKKIENITVNGFSTINFIIGGSYGTIDEIRKISNFSLSFSKMTFPHQLMRVILIEQIYRAFSILKNTKYHK